MHVITLFSTLSTMQIRKHHTPFCLLAALLVLVGIVAVSTRTSAKARGFRADAVTVKFVGYTNGPGRGRLVVFQVNNSSPLEVERDYYHEIQEQSAAGWSKSQPTVYLPGYARGPVIGPGRSEVFHLKAPGARNRWRLCMNYVEHEGLVRRFSGDLLLRLQKAGFGTKYRRARFTAYSDEIEP